MFRAPSSIGLRLPPRWSTAVSHKFGTHPQVYRHYLNLNLSRDIRLELFLCRMTSKRLVTFNGADYDAGGHHHRQLTSTTRPVLRH